MTILGLCCWPWDKSSVSPTGGFNPAHDAADCRAELFIGFLGCGVSKRRCRGFMSLVSPTLSLVGPVQGAQGTRRGSQSWGCRGGGRRPLEPDPWWALKPPPDWRWSSPKSINPTTVSSTDGCMASPAALLSRHTKFNV